MGQSRRYDGQAMTSGIPPEAVIVNARFIADN
jgi:hypothetical protein